MLIDEEDTNRSWNKTSLEILEIEKKDMAVWDCCGQMLQWLLIKDTEANMQLKFLIKQGHLVPGYGEWLQAEAREI